MGVQKLLGAVPNASGGVQIISGGGCAPPKKSVPGSQCHKCLRELTQCLTLMIKGRTIRKVMAGGGGGGGVQK